MCNVLVKILEFLLELLNKRKRITLSCDVDLVGEIESPRRMIILRAVNRSPYPVSIIRAGIRVRKGRIIDVVDELDELSKQVPKTLPTGEYVTILFPADYQRTGTTLEDRLTPIEVKTLEAYVVDAEGKEHIKSFPKYWVEQVLNRKKQSANLKK